MRILRLGNSGATYTSNVYLLLGDWSGIGDVNTLIDVGRDPAVMDSLKGAPTGVGKRAVEQVILTHGHYDHSEMLGRIRSEYAPRVFAHDGSLEGVDEGLIDGQTVRAGDQVLEVIHAPGHSSDSVCLYCEQNGALFAGDVPLLTASSDGAYESGYAAALKKICARDVRSIHFGHGEPLLEGCNARLQNTYDIVQKHVRRESGQ